MYLYPKSPIIATQEKTYAHTISAHTWMGRIFRTPRAYNDEIAKTDRHTHICWGIEENTRTHTSTNDESRDVRGLLLGWSLSSLVKSFLQHDAEMRVYVPRSKSDQSNVYSKCTYYIGMHMVGLCTPNSHKHGSTFLYLDCGVLFTARCSIIIRTHKRKPFATTLQPRRRHRCTRK